MSASETSHFSNTIENYLQAESKHTKDILNQLSLIVYSLESEDTDLYQVARIIQDNQLVKLIEYFDKPDTKSFTLTLPSKNEFKDCLLLSIVYYLHEIKKYNWSQIKSLLEVNDYKVSSVALGKKILKLKEKINTRLHNMMVNFDFKEIEKIISSEL